MGPHRAVLFSFNRMEMFYVLYGSAILRCASAQDARFRCMSCALCCGRTFRRACPVPCGRPAGVSGTRGGRRFCGAGLCSVPIGRGDRYFCVRTGVYSGGRGWRVPTLGGVLRAWCGSCGWARVVPLGARLASVAIHGFLRVRRARFRCMSCALCCGRTFRRACPDAVQASGGRFGHARRTAFLRRMGCAAFR